MNWGKIKIIKVENQFKLHCTKKLDITFSSCQVMGVSREL